MENQWNIFFKKTTTKKSKPSSSGSNPPVKRWRIFVDGASRNNPGPSGAGIYITYQNKVICKEGYYLGKKTNNQAEYLALLISLFITEKKQKKLIKSTCGMTNIIITITTDSELLVKQMKGEYKVRNTELKKIKHAIDTILKDKTYEIKHVLRDKNKIADELANKGIDTKKSLPKEFASQLKMD